MKNDDIKPGEQLTLAQINRLRKQALPVMAYGNGGGAPGLRQDGPTIAEFVSAGYKATDYPPEGYSSRSSTEEIKEAIVAQKKDETETDPFKMKVPELKEWLTRKGIAFESNALKEDLQALVPKE